MKRRRQKYDHVRSMEQKKFALIAFEAKPTDRRLFGRPPKRWKNS